MTAAGRRHSAVAALAVAAACAVPVRSEVGRVATGECPLRFDGTSIEVALPGPVFQALPVANGCWLVASMPAAMGGAFAILQNTGGDVALRHVVRATASPTGMALTPDGVLVAAAGDQVLFLDVGRLTRGDTTALLGGIGGDLPGAGRVYARVSPDGHFAFISDERAYSITVIDLARARASGYRGTGAIVGRIPVGRAPIAIEFSADGRYIYTTSQDAPVSAGWPRECRAEGRPQEEAEHAAGAIIVLDYLRATTRPDSSAIVSMVHADCTPVRLVVSPDGARVYASARASNRLLVFDAAKLVADPRRARIATIPVGTAPVGVAVTADGRRVLVTSSNRFAGSPTDRQPVTIIDAGRVEAGAGAILGTVTAGAFPREMRWMPGGRVLVLTNFASRTVQLIDADRIAGGSAAPPPLPSR